MIDETDDVDESVEDAVGFDALLEFLHRSRGFDFTGYKRSSLTRRVQRRMQAVGTTTFREYLDHLEVHPNEFPQLFNMLLINVTSFFRDPAAWDALRTRLAAVVDVAGERPIRAWSAGCSSGEEPYTLAIVLCELLGTDAFIKRAKIYATDLDEDALAFARQATYSQKSLESVPPELVEKYFVRIGSGFVFNPELRRTVIFGRHDLVQDAPIPRIDVLACRNALMYFNSETQTRVLGRLQFALNPEGILMLGKAEMLLTHADLFAPLDLKLRLFTRASRSLRLRDRGLDPQAAAAPGATEERIQVQRAAFEASGVAQVVIDPRGNVALTNHRARQMFGISLADVGRAFHELELSYRPAELRSCIDRVRLERRAIQLKEIERALSSGEKTYLDIDVTPLVSEQGAFLGTQVSFADVTQSHRLQSELRRTNVELEAAQEELQSASEELETTNEELQSTVEELETTNEELQSTNEELQSTNEELETMNEELQSTNEELQTINGELRQRGGQLNDLNAFHSSVLGSLSVGVVVLDRDLLIRTWNRRMQDLWGVRSEEVERKHFVNLDIGLPVERLTAAVRACLMDGARDELILPCTNRRGRAVDCRVRTVPLDDAMNTGVILLVEELT